MLRRTGSARSERENLLNQLCSWLSATTNTHGSSRYGQKRARRPRPSASSAPAPTGTAPLPAGPEAEGPRRAGRPDSFHGRAEPIVAAPAPPPPLPALLPPPRGGGSRALRSACVRSSRGLTNPLRSRLPSAVPRPPLPLFLRCSFPASRGCACESSSPAFWRLPICSAPSAPRGTRYGGRGPGRGCAAALCSALGSGRRRRPGRAPRARGTAAPAAPALLLLVRGPFSWAAELPAWPGGREAALSVPGERAGPGGRGSSRCSPRPGIPGFPTHTGAGPRSGAASSSHAAAAERHLPKPVP